MDKHYLDNMIFNLKNKKKLKEVTFTKQAVEEILEYLKILQNYEDRTNDLEKIISNYVDSNISFYEENKKLKEQNKILEKALELICDYMEYDYSKKNDDVWYRKSKDLEMYFKNKAEEITEDE